MKNTLLFLLLSYALTAGAQNSIHTYTFDTDFKEAALSGPELSPLCTGSFSQENLPDYNITHSVYQFDENCGFVYDDSTTGFISSGNYTIELYFKLHDLSRWKRVIDFKSRSTDNGCYVLNGELNFYNIATSNGAPFSTDSFSHYVITRNGTTREVNMYGDGNQFISFIDDEEDAVYDSAKKLRFFQDDLIIPDEATSGSIALLRIYNYPLDAADVRDAYESLQEQLSTGIAEMDPLRVSISPNPAKDQISIKLPNQKDTRYRLVDMQGNIRQSGTLSGTVNNLSIDQLPGGIYLLQLFNNDENFIVKKFIKR